MSAVKAVHFCSRDKLSILYRLYKMKNRINRNRALIYVKYISLFYLFIFVNNNLSENSYLVLLEKALARIFHPKNLQTVHIMPE